VRLTLEYDGTEFAGWAAQPGLRTVEGDLRAALDRVYPSWQGLAVAGRTDAGVHALGQVASFSADGGVLALAGPDGDSSVVLGLEPEAWRAATCAVLAGADLTAGDRAAYPGVPAGPVCAAGRSDGALDR